MSPVPLKFRERPNDPVELFVKDSVPSSAEGEKSFSFPDRRVCASQESSCPITLTPHAPAAHVDVPVVSPIPW